MQWVLSFKKNLDDTISKVNEKHDMIERVGKIKNSKTKLVKAKSFKSTNILSISL